MVISLRNLSSEKPKRIHLRTLQTKAEAVLWTCLRARRFYGYKFYRQYGIGKFVLDFYCHERRLAIELDGEIHKKKTDYDNDRMIWLKNEHIETIRFWNNDVIHHTKEVLDVILKTLRQ